MCVKTVRSLYEHDAQPMRDVLAVAQDPGGVVTKLRLLTIEGAQPGGPTLFDRLPLSAPRRRA